MHCLFFSRKYEWHKVLYFPTTRFIDYDKSNNFYYAYGNTPPQDLLQSVTADVSEPEVLLLGCGDIRSCLYTLHSHHFKGVHFVLNDISAAVLARNIIFLYLCAKMPSDKDDVVKWVASFWSIWFCHELLPQHKQVLMDALSQLLEWSKSIESWSRTDNPLHTLIQFNNSESLAKVHRVWQVWYNNDRSVEYLRTVRGKFLKLTGSSDYNLSEIHLDLLFGKYLHSKLTKSDCEHMKSEFKSYYFNGFDFAEGLLDLPIYTSTSANSTFFEITDGTYNVHNNLFPYRCFFHLFQFSPENVKRHEHSGLSLMIEDKRFSQQPLLANSLQQFSIWVRSCAEIFSKLHYIKFTLHCSDALEFCYLLSDRKNQIFCPHLFDAIYASNLFDVIAPPSLVMAAMSVLKQSGFLFTDTFRHFVVSQSLGFIEALFGLESKSLPLIYGIRCSGNDEFSDDEISVKPVPCTAGGHPKILKSFTWEHVEHASLKKTTKDDFESTVQVLCKSINHMLTCCIDRKGSVMQSMLCTETVILLLKSFVLQFCSEGNVDANYQFWVPLCNKLLNQRSLQPFVTSIQTQSLLHGLHLHLTVSELNCPLCNKTSLESFVRQYSITLENYADDAGKYNEPRLSILIHNFPPDDKMVMKLWNEITSSCGNDVHVVDSIAGIEVQGSLQLQLDFFLPTSFLQKHYYASVVLFNYKERFASSSSVLMHKELIKCVCAETCYLFSQPQYMASYLNLVHSNFGEIVKHSGNAHMHRFQSTIALSEQSMTAIEDKHQITTNQASATKIGFTISNLHTEISYPYPIDYTKMSIKLSRKSKQITVVANRKNHHLYEEKPIHIVNPDNILSLPVIVTCDLEIIQQYSLDQFTEKDNDAIRKHGLKSKGNWNPVRIRPEVNVKKTLAGMFLQYKDNFFQLLYSGSSNVDQYCQNVQCFVVIQNRIIDLHNRTPAIDLQFCFVTPEKCKSMYKQWVSVLESEVTVSELKNIHLVDKKECQLLQKIFNYFASRTVSTFKSPVNDRHKLLIANKINHHFTRAVVYPLYPNSNNTELEMHNLFDFVAKQIPYQKMCSCCGNLSQALRRCSRCQLAHYCNQECQKKHWGTHKSVCRPLKPM